MSQRLEIKDGQVIVNGMRITQVSDCEIRIRKHTLNHKECQTMSATITFDFYELELSDENCTVSTQTD